MWNFTKHDFADRLQEATALAQVAGIARVPPALRQWVPGRRADHGSGQTTGNLNLLSAASSKKQGNAACSTIDLPLTGTVGG